MSFKCGFQNTERARQRESQFNRAGGSEFQVRGAAVPNDRLMNAIVFPLYFTVLNRFWHFFIFVCLFCPFGNFFVCRRFGNKAANFLHLCVKSCLTPFPRYNKKKSII